MTAESAVRFQGVDKSSTAYKLLASMGWEEGQGLGAQKQGIVSHVRVKRKADASGVGAAQEVAKAKDWTLGMAAYDKVLATLKTLATGGEGLPQRKSRKKTKVRIRKAPTEKSGAISSPAEEVDIEELKAPAKKKLKVTVKQAAGSATLQAESPAVQKRLVTHVGRFQKVARNKHVKNYSATDLAAILGAAEDQTPSQTHNDQPPEAVKPSFKESPQPQLPLAPEWDSRDPSDGSDVAETGTVWWQGHFVKAGGSGSGYASFSTAARRDVNVVGFSESDQANLWQNATDAQSKSKQGLGKGSAVRMASGNKWQGKKTRIDDSDEDKLEGEDAAVAFEDGGPHAELTDAVILPSKRTLAAELDNRTGNCQAVQQRSVSEMAMSQKKPIKWRKIAKAILASVEGCSMPEKLFKAKAWEMAHLKGSSDRKQSMEELMELVSKSKQFNVQHKRISLVMPET